MKINDKIYDICNMSCKVVFQDQGKTNYDQTLMINVYMNMRGGRRRLLIEVRGHWFSPLYCVCEMKKCHLK